MINIKKSKATTCALVKIQKKNFFTNLLQEMRQKGLIHRVGVEAGPGAKWILSKTIRKVDR
jgi:hypothetical protein